VNFEPPTNTKPPIDKAAEAQPPINLRLRVPPLAVTGIAALLAWSSAIAFPELSLPFAPVAWLSAAFLGLGVVCSALGVASFYRARTTVNPLQPEAATALVVSGIYRVTRDPMYLGFLFLLLGELAWLAHPLAWGVAPAFVVYLNRFQIAPEEHALRERFGAEYANYASRVPRWL
jgi:protein-S-isoprenylcysteine O-methyltransferase Ste14